MKGSQEVVSNNRNGWQHFCFAVLPFCAKPQAHGVGAGPGKESCATPDDDKLSRVNNLDTLVFGEDKLRVDSLETLAEPTIETIEESPVAPTATAFADRRPVARPSTARPSAARPSAARPSEAKPSAAKPSPVPSTPSEDSPDNVPTLLDETAAKPIQDEVRLSEAAIKSRMNRILAPTVSGSYKVSESVIKQWKAGGTSRTNLMKIFQSVGFDRDRV